MASIYRFTAVAALALSMGACTTKKTEPPAPSGPSELGTTLAIAATPDLLPQDGSSTSQVVIRAFDSNGQPVRNLSLRVEMAVGGVITDFGHLSAKDTSTGSDGRAVVVYTAPEPVDNVDRDTRVQIMVTPVNGNYNGTFARFAEIRLVPTGVVGGETNVPDFKIAPTAPKQLETVTFDASDAQLDQTLTKYEWDFGDGSKGQGRVTSHQFSDIDSYAVTLTVTDIAGLKGSRSKTVAVGGSGEPEASFVFSPGEPGIGEEIVFNGAGSTVAAPRIIVKYAWQFGTGSSASGMVVKKKYDTAGTYNVTLTVTDDAGNTATATQAVEVGTSSPGGLAAAFTVSPTSPLEDTVVNFNATTSTSADPITNYKWDFGDGGTASTAQKTATHTFDDPGTYVVTLTIRDSKGRTATTTKNVTVAAP
jgi:PKD repeat protein